VIAGGRRGGREGDDAPEPLVMMASSRRSGSVNRRRLGPRRGRSTRFKPMQRLAIHTCGVLAAPYHHLVNRTFMESVGPVLDGAHDAPGFIAKLDEPYDVARFPMVAAVTSDPTRVLTTLSTWRDLSTARQFSFRGTHAHALARRRDWFLATPWPSHVASWVSGAVPSWDEGLRAALHPRPRRPIPDRLHTPAGIHHRWHPRRDPIPLNRPYEMSSAGPSTFAMTLTQ
jgi:hypothetical protein